MGLRAIDRDETPFARVERLRNEKKHEKIVRALKAKRSKGQVKIWEM